MVSNPRSCIPLIRFTNDLKKSGLFIIGNVKLQKLDDFDVDPVINESLLWLKLLDMLSVKAFFELTLANSVREGFHHLARITGLGAMKPNTIFLGFYDNQPQIDFLQNDTNFLLIKASLTDSINDFPPLRPNGQKSQTEESYVTILSESIFKFKKNVCIGRHFNTFDRVSIMLLYCINLIR